MRRTRRQALAGAAGAAAALGAAPAAGAAGNDTALLEALLAYQQAVVASYELALRSAPLRVRDREVLAKLRDRAAQAAAALRNEVVRAGGKPAAPPASAPPAPAGSGRHDYLGYILGSEEAAVTGFYASLQALTATRLVTGAAAFMAQAGRRLVVVRRLAGDPLVPRAFETGEA